MKVFGLPGDGYRLARLAEQQVPEAAWARYELLRRFDLLRAKGLMVDAASAVLGLRRATYYRWRRQARGGVAPPQPPARLRYLRAPHDPVRARCPDLPAPTCLPQPACPVRPAPSGLPPSRNAMRDGLPTRPAHLGLATGTDSHGRMDLGEFMVNGRWLTLG
jgi:hypothetical protein